LRKYEKRIPHITNLAGRRFWNVGLLNEIVEELNLGRTIDEALANLGIEEPS